MKGPKPAKLSIKGLQPRVLIGKNPPKPAGFADMRKFIADVHSGTTPERMLLEKFAVRFKRILDGVNVRKALDLQTGKGNRRNAERQTRDQKIAFAVHDLRNAQDRISLEDAIEAVAPQFHLSSERVRRIYMTERKLWPREQRDLRVRK